MATDAPEQESLTIRDVDEQRAARRVRKVASEAPLLRWLMPLASLRLTVVLFVAAIFLVFAGTLAQVDKDIWEVVKLYFRTYVAWIDFQIFFPPAFTGKRWEVPGGFYFPGGFTIGALMFVNLIAAHALRFKVQARGTRLWAGLGVIALGCLLTWMVVVTGSTRETIEHTAPVSYNTLWTVMKWTLVLLWGAGAYLAWQLDSSRKIERWLLVSCEVIVGGLLFYLFLAGERASLGDSSMRIMWQLIEGGFAAAVLLAGCIMVFRKRGGIVLLHGGIMLVMANELVVHTMHVEQQMRISEGETVNHASDVRSIELAVTDTSAADTNQVVVVPQWMLEEMKDIRDEQLPFDLQIDKFIQNAKFEPAKPGEPNPATAGFGSRNIAVDVAAGAGTDVGGQVDITSAYVTLLKKGTKDKIGTWLVSVGLNDQPVSYDGKNYEIALRFQREYKPYNVKLDDVRADMYLGTNKPKNYSSDIRLVDPSRNVDTDVHIWMNNPLRYGGETFYQSDYGMDTSGREFTVFSIVSNTGWMIPYVACMLVGTGMIAQFGITLSRFMRRRDEVLVAPTSRGRRAVVATTSAAAQYGPIALVALIGVCVVAMAWPRPLPTTQMKLDEFGRLPVVADGRIKPIDSLARSTLKNLSGKETFKDKDGKTQPAVRWLLDTIARPADAHEHKVVQIYSLEVLDTLGLERREGFRFSNAEIETKFEEFTRQVQQAEEVSEKDPKKLTMYQQKLLELAKKMRMVQLIGFSFDFPQLREDHLKEDLTAASQRLQMLSRLQVPLVVPPREKDEQWQSFAAGAFDVIKDRFTQKETNKATELLAGILIAYSKGDIEAFNSEVAKYQTWLAEKAPGEYNDRRINAEAFYNAFAPLFWAWILYLLAFVLVALSWLGWSKPLSRAAFWMIILALGFHTFGLVDRIYISGRPPVTNLYSSAVFIGWGCVVLGLILECIYRLGIGNVIGAVAGFLGLAIAIFGLDDGSDTLGVLQAVLDTQFWLATHVVCITLGYATTFIAGLLGIVYILRGVLTPSLSADVAKDTSRMIYGTVCFAMFFSFVGTVLGGLWADDSWGRFWGWDPKENGALIIVLWNALVLHARWGAIVKERGLAALAVAGNIVTAWSWFGVNELGVGLHSYGFTDGVLMALGLFIVSQLAIISLAMLPKNSWWSSRAGHSV